MKYSVNLNQTKIKVKLLEEDQLDYKRNKNKTKFNNNLDSKSLTKIWQIYKSTMIKLYKTNSSIVNLYLTNFSTKLPKIMHSLL